MRRPDSRTSRRRYLPVGRRDSMDDPIPLSPVKVSQVIPWESNPGATGKLLEQPF